MPWEAFDLTNKSVTCKETASRWKLYLAKLIIFLFEILSRAAEVMPNLSKNSLS